MTSIADLPDTTPVLVGVGQASERLGEDGFEALSAAELAGRAAQAALDDTGATSADIAAAIDTIAAVRQFEISTPLSVATLGRSTNLPRSIGARIGATPTHAILEVTGGQAPQHLVNEFAARIASGEHEVVLLAGSEAISTERHFAAADPADKPDFTEVVGGSLDDRGYGLRGLISAPLMAHGLLQPVEQYAMFENARRARLGISRDGYARTMGELFAPFTRVAAANPHAAAPRELSVDDITTVTDRNRWIAEPYPRFLVARDQVNQGAAVLMMSVGAARRLCIEPGRWVYLHGHADLVERPVLDRPDLSAAPSAIAAARHALDIAGIGIGDLSSIDLYSCFPVAVSNVADALGFAADDPRGLTVTGGLPYFGGAGNNYSMHAIAETVDRCRAMPGSYGFVGANGGQLSKYSVGVYGTTPTAYRPGRSADVQAELDAAPLPALTSYPEGPATIETYTVTHRPDGVRTGYVIGRLDVTGERFVATVSRDDAMLDLLTGDDEPIGQPMHVTALGHSNRVTTTAERMAVLRPPTPTGFREAYEFVEVRRDGHLLEITINRPDARNALHPPAHEELQSIIDAYEADPELWVAIITGAGTQAFCSGNDLLWTASGKPTYFPRSGFAGLTSRRLTKLMIAAVNGYAMGGGLETAMSCHLIVADETAQFALSEVRVGLVAAAGGVVRLPHHLPPKIAHEMILTGRRMGAAEALERGLINRVTAPGQALDGARALAADILAGSPTSVRISLAMMTEAAQFADPHGAVTAYSRALDDLIVAEDTFEGLTAFGAKRTPQWKNR